MQKPQDFGDLFTVQDFVSAVNDGLFVDNDGTGYYRPVEENRPSQEAVPSEIRAGKVRWDKTHVMWFNK